VTHQNNRCGCFTLFDIQDVFLALLLLKYITTRLKKYMIPNEILIGSTELAVQPQKDGHCARQDRGDDIWETTGEHNENERRHMNKVWIIARCAALILLSLSFTVLLLKRNCLRQMPGRIRRRPPTCLKGTR